jgi:hypothetical protein
VKPWLLDIYAVSTSTVKERSAAWAPDPNVFLIDKRSRHAFGDKPAKSQWRVCVVRQDALQEHEGG